MHQLPPLPYGQHALNPVISSETVAYHYGKHHKGYVKKLNAALEHQPHLQALPLEALIREVHGSRDRQGLFNNAAQTWNHTFYWHSMSPNGGGEPGGALKQRLESDLGGVDAFRKAFKTAATGRFGSGWAWLVEHNGKLAVTSTANADTPLAQGHKPLLTLDVWEHAYYLDYQNRRGKYVDAWLDKLINWDFAAQNLAG